MDTNGHHWVWTGGPRVVKKGLGDMCLGKCQTGAKEKLHKKYKSSHTALHILTKEVGERGSIPRDIHGHHGFHQLGQGKPKRDQRKCPCGGTKGSRKEI